MPELLVLLALQGTRQMAADALDVHGVFGLIPPGQGG